MVDSRRQYGGSRVLCLTAVKWFACSLFRLGLGWKSWVAESSYFSTPIFFSILNLFFFLDNKYPHWSWSCACLFADGMILFLRFSCNFVWIGYSVMRSWSCGGGSKRNTRIVIPAENFHSTTILKLFFCYFSIPYHQQGCIWMVWMYYNDVLMLSLLKLCGVTLYIVLWKTVHCANLSSRFFFPFLHVLHWLSWRDVFQYLHWTCYVTVTITSLLFSFLLLHWHK